MSSIIKSPPRSLAPVSTAAEARDALVAARARLEKRLEAVENLIAPPLAPWRAAVKKHPLITIGGAFLVGYAISRLLSRK
jgi:ElaB/YqjD/DUF883 family membrane-anchored ribosome-binding protein